MGNLRVMDVLPQIDVKEYLVFRKLLIETTGFKVVVLR